MTKLFRFIVVVFVVLLCATLLVACGTDNNQDSTTEGENTTTGNTTADSDNTEGTVTDQYAITDSTVVLTVVVGDNTHTFTKAEFDALDVVEFELTRTNSENVTTTGTYTGVTWSTLAAAVGCDSTSSVSAVSSDGYQSIISNATMIDSNSLFALYQDDDYIDSEDNGYIWFCASENFTANCWVKYITKLTVQ